MPSLKDLPTEIFDAVLSYFTGRELRDSRLVNRKFRDAIDDKIWRSIEISFEAKNIIISNVFGKFRNPLDHTVTLHDAAVNSWNNQYGLVTQGSAFGQGTSSSFGQTSLFGVDTSSSSGQTSLFGVDTSSSSGQTSLFGRGTAFGQGNALAQSKALIQQRVGIFQKYEAALDYFASLYGARFKRVTIDETCSPNSGAYSKVILEKLRPNAGNISVLHLILSYAVVLNDLPVIQGAYYTLEIRGRTGELVSSMIDKVYHKECGKLDVIIPVAVPVSNLSYSLFMSYGDTIKTLRLEIKDADAVVHLNNFMEFCVNLETLGLIVSKEIELPLDSVVELPDSVRVLDFPTSVDTPGLTINARGLKSFKIDFNTVPNAGTLNLTVNRLILVNCSGASDSQIAKINTIVFQDMLEIDTMNVEELIRFTPVIKRARGSLSLWDDEPETFGKGPDYMSSYIEWFKAMQDAISHIRNVLFKLPLLPPQKLKQLISRHICSVMPNLVQLHFKQDLKQLSSIVNLERQYPFLKQYGFGQARLEYKILEELKKEGSCSGET